MKYSIIMQCHFLKGNSQILSMIRISIKGCTEEKRKLTMKSIDLKTFSARVSYKGNHSATFYCSIAILISR